MRHQFLLSLVLSPALLQSACSIAVSDATSSNSVEMALEVDEAQLIMARYEIEEAGMLVDVWEEGSVSDAILRIATGVDDLPPESPVSYRIESVAGETEGH